MPTKKMKTKYKRIGSLPADVYISSLKGNLKQAKRERVLEYAKAIGVTTLLSAYIFASLKYVAPGFENHDLGLLVSAGLSSIGGLGILTQILDSNVNMSWISGRIREDKEELESLVQR